MLSVPGLFTFFQAAAIVELAYRGKLREVDGGLELWYERGRERWVYTHRD